MSRTDARAPRPAAAILFALVASLSGCGGDSAPAGRGAGAPPAVVTTTVLAAAPWSDTIEALGTAQANESVTLTAKVTETVDSVNFEDGQFVQAGHVLVDLSGGAEAAQLREEQAAYQEAQQQLDRQAGLVEKGTIARSQLDTQVAARDSAKARMDTIRARLADRVITAPFDGVLGFRRVSQGTLVSPGTEIATLDDIRTIKLDFPVPETFLSNVASGQTIVAQSAAWPEQEFSGTVRAVDSRVDPVTRAVTVRAEIANPDSQLRPGMLLAVRLLKPERQALALPELALVQVGSRAYVYKVGADDKVEQVEVKIGARRRGEVEIVEGVVPGDRIVVEGTVKLRNGAAITEAEATVPVAATVASDAP
jgi:membrane fusion protein (multidrug efflux system)